jgi:hypothetical protein
VQQTGRGACTSCVLKIVHSGRNTQGLQDDSTILPVSPKSFAYSNLVESPPDGLPFVPNSLLPPALPFCMPPTPNSPPTKQPSFRWRRG